MRVYDLLRVEEGPARFEELLRAAGEAGFKVGWLEWDGDSSRPLQTPLQIPLHIPLHIPLAAPLPEPLPPSLEQAAMLGALRAVAVTAGGSVVVKRRQGPAVERDLVREHFAGCRLILAQGQLDIGRLSPVDGGWEVSALGGECRRYSTAELVRRLASPKPLAGAESA